MLINKMNMMKRWFRSRRSQVFIIIFIMFSAIFYFHTPKEVTTDVRSSPFDAFPHTTELQNPPKAIQPMLKDLTPRRNAIIHYLELSETLKEDKGTGCEIPMLDPFAKEMMRQEASVKKVGCTGTDWVKCYHNECRVVKTILETASDINCSYQDILFKTDRSAGLLGPPTNVIGDMPYYLTKSDHVRVTCTGTLPNRFLKTKWVGLATGFRSQIDLKPVPSGREDSIDVLMFLFDSTSKNGFIRRMPNSYKTIKELGAIILDGYNIVGDGTPAALFPMMTGKTELEMPDVRTSVTKTGTFNISDFIFAKLKDYGYNTAYFEDSPQIGTFQYRFNGFNAQPADHYLRHFYLDQITLKNKHLENSNPYCVGDTLRYELMMNLTTQFFLLPGKHFCFTFVADITHDDFSMISNSDDAFVAFLTYLKESGVLDNTMVFIAGDHGARYAGVRNTYQGKLEERLPLMAILLPKALTDSRPDVQAKLESNVKTLTTPHDIYATYLDALDLKHLQSSYRVKGADLYRGLSLLETIPTNRSCSEAGIEPHWCTCLRWKNVSPSEEIYLKAANAFVDYINELTEPVSHKCEKRTLTSVEYVMRQQPHKKLLQFKQAQDSDGYIGKFGSDVKRLKENYQVKVTVGPGVGIYEASGVYLVKENKFVYNIRDISRVNAYNNEPSCISETHPHLNMYCYCNSNS